MSFLQSNYILEDDSLLTLEQPQFDVILCLSVTKWIHLNWGDDGLKQAFRRMYIQLRPGGKLILEPQNWASYKKKKNLTVSFTQQLPSITHQCFSQETIYRNYHSIEFFPDKFIEYLLSPMVGFAKSEVLCYPHSQNKGFQRYIYIYTKSTMFPSERVECPTPNVCSGSTKDQERTDPLETCSSFRLEEEDTGVPSLRSGSSSSVFANGDCEDCEDTYVANGNGCSPLRLGEERDVDTNSSPSRGNSRVSGPLPEDDEDSRISGPPPAGESEQNGVYVNGNGSSLSYIAVNGVTTNGEEENLSGDNT